MPISENLLEPSRPGRLRVLQVRLKAVFRFIVRGRFRELVGHAANFVYRRKHPGYPWLARPANSILESFLTKDDVGLEFGSGRSTIWFAERVAALTSIEHDPAWHNKVTKALALRKLRNVDSLLVRKDVEDGEGKGAAYVQITAKFPRNSFDFILVDGAYRDYCALASLPLVRPGGLLIIDDAHWFLPSGSTSPKARTYAQGPASLEWEEFKGAVTNWRRIWTTDGIHDTILYIKPCE